MCETREVNADESVQGYSPEHRWGEQTAWSVRRAHSMGRTADRPREQQRVGTTRKKTRGIRLGRAGRGHRGSLEGRSVELSRGGGRPRVVDAKTRLRRDKQRARVRNKLNLEREEQSSASCERVRGVHRSGSPHMPLPSAYASPAATARPQCMTAMATGHDHGPMPGRPYELSVDTLAHGDRS